MKNALLVLSLAAMCLVLTNPSEDDHRDFVRDEIKEAIDMDNIIVDSVLGAISRREVSSDNYILFSVTKIRGKSVGIGIFFGIYLLDF